MFLSESARCPAPAGSVSFNVVRIKSVVLSDWMAMVTTNGNGDDDTVCSMATVLDTAMVTVMCYPTTK